MAWKYQQSTGKLTGPDEGEFAALGYSGNGVALNDPDSQHIPDRGPIPRGRWHITQFFDDPGGKGPVVAHLYPLEGTETFGRSGFMIHGDNSAANHSASEGCIILPRWIRAEIADSEDHTLEVTA